MLVLTLQAICGYFMLVLSLLSALLAVRLYSVASIRGFIRLRLARQLIVFTLVDSWLFCWASAVILFGVGSSLNHTACEIGIWWCIACESHFYCPWRRSVAEQHLFSVRIKQGYDLP